MRPLEWLLVGGDGVLLLTLVAGLARPRLVFLAAALAAIAGLQLGLEGFRWQLTPACLVAALLILLAAIRPPHRGPTRLALAAAGLPLLIGAAALPALIPVFAFPPPTGPYGIGTLTYHWIDAGRPEAFTTDPDDHRELMVQLFYPAAPGAGAPGARYAEGTDFSGITGLVHLPAWFFDHLAYVRTHAQPAAPMTDASARFPVLLFSTGRGGYRDSSNYQIEELVSHGYVIAAIDHPYTSSGIIFPDGRVIKLDPRVASSSLDESVGEDSFMLSVFDTLGADAAFVLSQLAVLDASDQNGILTGRLDLARVGIFGTSLGGITTAEACRLDPRFRACLILDVAMPPDVVAAGLTQPTMWISRNAEIMRQEGWTASAIHEHQTTMRAVFGELRNDGYLVLLPGMYHVDMTDFPYILPPPLGGLAGALGPGDWHRTHRAINAFSLAFFDRYLKATPASTLTAVASSFPGVDVQIHHR